MARVLLILFLFFPVFPLFGETAGIAFSQDFREKPDSLTVMFWNLENFFDPRDGGQGPADREFSSYGKRHWTWKRFEAKKNAIAKTILHIGEANGALPDVIGFAEVENSYVLWSLCHSLPLKKLDYAYVHYDSPDHRGIDVGLLYRKSTVRLLASFQVPLMQGTDTLRTRAILAVRALSHGRNLQFLVNHHPSKFSGAKASAASRVLAMETMASLCPSDSSGRGGTGAAVIAMGDFNDVPDAEQLLAAEKKLVNLGRNFLGKDVGTIRFEGKWQLIDFFLVSPALAHGARMSVCREPHLLVRDARHAGEKPYRTYSGPRYLGGVSDHLPILLKVG